MELSGSKDKIFRRIWGRLPALVLFFLIICIVVLFAEIKDESGRIKAEKLAALHNNRPPVNVAVLDIRPVPIRDRLTLPAQVEPWVELEILAEVQGRIIDLSIKEGDIVVQGDLLVSLDPRDYENERDAVRAEHELALLTLSRTKELFSEKLVTRALIDRDSAGVDRLSAELKNAEIRLERTSITAPMSGIVNRLTAKKGLYLKAHDPVAVLLDISRVKISVGIPESDVDAVRKLKDFKVIIDALEGKSVTGRRSYLSKSPENTAHLYKLELEVPNRDHKILPGMFARVNIVKREVKNSISVPLYSVITRENEKFVFIEKDGMARVRMVETGILEGWRVEITKGLEQGDHVIVMGQRNVDEGQEVKVSRTVTDPEDLFK